MDVVNKALAQLAEQFRSLSPAARLAAAGLVVVVLASAAYLVQHQLSASDELLSADEIPADRLVAMEEAFAKANLTSYSLDGARIRIPRGQRPAYWAALVEAKVLTPKLDFSALDAPSSVFESPEACKQRLKNKIQRELALIIRSMKGIQDAYVLYDAELPQGFGREKVVTASVGVKPLGGEPLDESAVATIRQFVASAIAGLKPERVTVTDLNGPARRGNGQSGSLAAAGAGTARAMAADTKQSEKPQSQRGDDVSLWLSRNRNTLVLVGLLAAVFVAWRLMVRAAPAASVRASLSPSTASDSEQFNRADLSNTAEEPLPSNEQSGAETPASAATEPATAENPPAEDEPFQFLQQAEVEKLAAALAEERPQTIALVLSHLPPGRAGTVLARLPAGVQVEVIHRLVDLEETDPAIVREVEAALESRVADEVQAQRRRIGGLQAVAGILEAADGAVGMQILDNLAAQDQSLADKLGSGPIEFDELVELDDDLLDQVVAAVPHELIFPALLGSKPALCERVLGHLPRGEAAAVRKRLARPGPLLLSDIEEARQRITTIARRVLFCSRQGRGAHPAAKAS
jgi:flagellar motor switch protein FliG/type III secretory pathway lipoprotein EscJ